MKGALNSKPMRRQGGARAIPALRPVVLHIDDDPNDSALFRAAILQAQLDFDLQNVESGERAIAYLSGSGDYADRGRYPLPSLILLDVKMPRANGLEVLKWIRTNCASPKVPVVMLSGSELKDDMQSAYSNGADSYVIKPLGFAALVDLVKSLNVAWLLPEAASCRRETGMSQRA